MAGVLLVAYQGVIQLRCGPQYIGQGADGGAGVTEDHLHALPQQSFHQDLSACNFHRTFLLLDFFRGRPGRLGEKEIKKRLWS